MLLNPEPIAPHIFEKIQPRVWVWPKVCTVSGLEIHFVIAVFDIAPSNDCEKVNDLGLLSAIMEKCLPMNLWTAIAHEPLQGVFALIPYMTGFLLRMISQIFNKVSMRTADVHWTINDLPINWIYLHVPLNCFLSLEFSKLTRQFKVFPCENPALIWIKGKRALAPCLSAFANCSHILLPYHFVCRRYHDSLLLLCIFDISRGFS